MALTCLSCAKSWSLLCSRATNPMALAVDTFHRKGEFVIFDDGSQAPITNWFDDEGDDCGGFDHPVSFVAGPDANGDWHTIDLSDFEAAKVH